MTDVQTEVVRAEAVQDEAVQAEDPRTIAKRELRVFLFLTVVLAPVLAVGVVAAYGFAVWILQLLIFGPPAG